jgi:hydroxypyruvate isomerase
MTRDAAAHPDVAYGNTPMKLVACIEWLFKAEHEDLAERIYAARDAGMAGVEFHLWRDKPLDAIERALDETGLHLSSFCIEPRRSLVDPAEHEQVLSAVRDAIPIAQRFAGAKMILASGFARADVPAAMQQAAATNVLKRAAELAQQSGTVLLLEPVNMIVNGAPMFVQEVERGLDIVEAVDSPALQLLCDVYHSAVSGENLASALGKRMRFVGHVQVADAEGRHEPGSGGIDWPAVMNVLRDQAYGGELGLEYLPSRGTLESLALTRRTLHLQ